MEIDLRSISDRNSNPNKIAYYITYSLARSIENPPLGSILSFLGMSIFIKNQPTIYLFQLDFPAFDMVYKSTVPELRSRYSKS